MHSEAVYTGVPSFGTKQAAIIVTGGGVKLGGTDMSEGGGRVIGERTVEPNRSPVSVVFMLPHSVRCDPSCCGVSLQVIVPVCSRNVSEKMLASFAFAEDSSMASAIGMIHMRS